MKEKQLLVINRIIFILSIIGICIAFYVTQSFLRKTNIICVNTGCEIVRKSSASYIFGIPVPMFGLAGYSILAVCAFFRTSSIHNKMLINLMLAVSTFGVVFVSWFTYTELFIIQAVCTWCAISAITMISIFILSLKSFLGQTHEIHR